MSSVDSNIASTPSAASLPSLAGLRTRAGNVMSRDRHPISRELQRIAREPAQGSAVGELVARLIERIERSEKVVAARQAGRPKVMYPPDLPVVERREEIAKAIAENQVVVICGETGSGKTTQLPKICLELGRGVAGMIGHTQPRRIAARSVAQRLASELQTSVGAAVGFKVRFSEQVSADSYVKLMTDGILLAEIQSDRFLTQYDTIIIDEAHERSLNIDFLLGYLRNLLPKRPDLKLIITSATIDPERFSRHFENAPIVMVSGRTYPVEVHYRPLMSDNPDDAAFEMQDAIARAVDELWSQEVGDILIFLAGERDIRETAETLRRHFATRADILPLYARLSSGEQMRVFQPHHRPRIVLSTNVAETSLTVPGIRYVIDTGNARVSRYSARTRLQRLPIEPISQASADQRKGRCGRVMAGVCVRLYSEEDFASRPRYTDPEILRTNLASVILQMKAFRLGNVEDFPFIEPPDYRQVRDGYQTLFELHAIDHNNELTVVGQTLARLPIDPRVGRMILSAHDEDALEEVLIIASALSVQDPRDRPMDKTAAADEAHARHRAGSSDFLTLVNLWHFYHDSLRTLSGSKLRKACRENYLSFVRLREWQEVQKQLREVISQMGWEPKKQPALPDAIHRALLSGLLGNVGVKGDTHEYTGVRDRKFHIFPGSSLFHKKPAWVMAAELVETTRVYARTVASIQPDWIERAADHLVKRSYTEPHWQRKSARVVAYEKVTLQGLAIVPKRTVNYGPIDAKKAREIFIDSALVQWDYETNAHFFRHNSELLREVELLEAKTRRNDLLADARTRFAFYDARIPAHVFDGASFEKWRRQAELQNKRLLFMTKQDLLMSVADPEINDRFPNLLAIDDLRLPLEYRFEPGHALDGVTATIPVGQLNQLPEYRIEWLVPGMLEEKIAELIRTLPKTLRVNVVPVPDFAARTASNIPFAKGRLLEAVGQYLGKVTGVAIPAEAFDATQLSPMFHMNLRVIDEAGKQIAIGRDLAAIRHTLRDRLRVSFETLPPSPWMRDEITKWDFGDLPSIVDVRHNGLALRGHPALVDKGNSISLRVLETPEAARQSTRRGVRRLFMIDYRREFENEIKLLPDLDAMSLHYAPLGRAGKLRNELTAAIADRLMFGDMLDVRTKQEYELRVHAAWNRMRTTTEQVGEIARNVLASYHDIQLRMGNPFAPLAMPAVIDIRQNLAELLSPEFLSITPRDWLPHLPRFTKAIQQRLLKLSNAGLKRDQAGMATLYPLLDFYRKIKVRTDLTPAKVEELAATRWVVEELRVSLFAQELKTSMPVSPQRIEAMLKAVAPI